MKREERFKAFFKALKISLKNFSIYNKDHPTYKKSIKRLKSEFDKLLDFFDHSIQISFTSNSIYIGSHHLKEEKLYVDVAKMFHFRKVESLQIKSSVSIEELEIFFSKFYLPRKDIYKKGGIRKLLEQEKIPNINVTELDYSQLLKGEGEEIKDIWTYLLKEAAGEKDEKKMDYLAENYDRIYDKVDAEQILSDDELSQSFESFFNYLSQNKKQKYISFSKRLLKSVVTSKEISKKEKIKKLKPLLTDLSEDDLATSLWEEITTDDKFDHVSFSIFSKLIEKEKHSKIAESLLDVFSRKRSFEEEGKTKQKIKELLSGTSSPFISQIYRNALQSLLQGLSEKPKKLNFDDSHLQKNYHLILLNLLDKESDKQAGGLLINILLKEWEKIIQQEGMEYLRKVHETLDEKREVYSSIKNYHELRSTLVRYIEELILKGELSLQFNYFIENIEQSTNTENVYLEKIFTEETITPYILKAFFRFFTDYLFYFNLNLEQKASDPGFLKKIIESLSLVDSPISLITLKNIFRMGNELIQLKSLKAMENLTEHDDKFLYPLLKKKNYDIKKEAFLLLARRESSKHKALNKLFSLKSPLGLRNKRLHHHIQIMDELDVKSAKKHLISLSSRKFIWNKKLRDHAKNVLRKWDVRKS